MDRRSMMLAALLLIAPPALAQHDAHHPNPAAQAAQPLASGEVRKVDKAAAKITIRHGPIASMDMPAMTMVFQVKDKAMLEQVKPGDKIRFDAEKAGGAYVVTRMEPAQ